jgi:hypothetical protein
MTMQKEKAGRIENEPTIVRPLGKMERSIWFCDQASPTNIGLGCEIHGEVTEEALRKALKWCQIRYPILRSVIRSGDKTLYLASYNVANAPEIPLEISEGTPEDEDRVVMEEMRKPLDGSHGIMVRAKLLRFGLNRSFLSIVFSHVIGDGFSAVLLLQDTINFLGKYVKDGAIPDPEPLPFPPPSEKGIAAEHRGWKGLKKLFAVQKEVAGDIKRYGAKPSPVRVQADPPLSDRKIKCNNFSLTESETRVLVARAKQEKVSLFALLGALLLDALHPFLEPTTKKNGSSDRVASFAAPVDMRPFLTSSVKEHFGFYSSAVNQLCLLGEKNDIPALAKQLHADLTKSFLQKKVHLHTTPLLAEFLGWRWLFPVADKGVARVAKFTGGMFKSCATSMTFLNDSIVIQEDHGITISRPRGHISPSIMGAALYCVLLYKNVITVHLNYNEGQFTDADAKLLNERFRGNMLAMG